MSDESRVEFFTISDARYFPGLVGLYNSLRLLGHGEPVTVLDRGMTARQRSALEAHCRLVSLEERVVNPVHLTAYPHRLDPDGVIVVLDSDLLIVRRLAEAIARARNGRVCMFRDPEESRFFEEWHELFGLGAPLRRRPYLNSGLVAFSTRAWPRLLQRWWETLYRIRDRPSWLEGASMEEDPTSQPDQDALNALLMSEIPEGAVHELPYESNVYSWDMGDVRITNLETMACERGSAELVVLHATGHPKPWSYRSVVIQRDAHAYLPLLRRATAWDDVPLAVPKTLLPPWLRPGAAGRAAFALVETWIRMPKVYRGLRRLLHRDRH